MKPRILRAALCQIDTIVGDVSGNVARVLASAAIARERGTDLCIFPEMTLAGYPARDLLESPAFLAENKLGVQFVHERAPLPCLIGCALDVGDGRAPRAHNAAALVGAGVARIAYFHKTLLPTYDVFDEGRYFRPAASDHPQICEINGIKIGVTICEDMWNHPEIWPQSRYLDDPIKHAVERGAQMIVNLSASPFALNKHVLRHGLAAAHARQHGVPFLFCNLIGGNDELIFDGASFALDSRGQLAARGAFAREDLLIVDLDLESGEITGADAGAPASEIEETRDALVLGLADYASKCGFKRAVIGLSGGIDSAVTAALAAAALGPQNVTGITMPSRYSSSGSVDDSRTLAANLGIELLEIPIESIFAAYLSTLESPLGGAIVGVTQENLQARIRGAILMAHSNRTGSLLLSTGNKSELAVGYCTLYGDMCGGLAVISDLYKTRVYEQAALFNRDRQLIPQSTMTKPPSAELRPDQKDEDSLPPYAILDRILMDYIENGHDCAAILARTGYDRQLVQDVLKMVDRNEYKRRQMPPGLRISSKSFGVGRRLPIARGRQSS